MDVKTRGQPPRTIPDRGRSLTSPGTRCQEKRAEGPVGSRLCRVACFTVMVCASWWAAEIAWGDAVSSLIRTLQSAEDYKQRLVAAIGLARRKDPRAMPALIAALHDANDAVQGVAADVLGEMGDHRARSALEALIRRTKNDFVRGRAKNALSRLPKAPPPPKAAPPKEADPDGMTVKGTTGTLDQEAVQAGIRSRFKAVMGCVNRRMADLPALGGTIQLKLRISARGSVRWARIVSSDLGSVQVEECIVEVLQTAKFEAPDGGETEFSIPLQFAGTATPEKLSPKSSKIARALNKACKKLLLNGSRSDPPLQPPSGLMVTMYLDPEGTVVSAGLAAEGKKIPGDFAQRFVENAKELKLGFRPGSGRYGKLSYRFSCSER